MAGGLELCDIFGPLKPRPFCVSLDNIHNYHDPLSVLMPLDFFLLPLEKQTFVASRFGHQIYSF